MKAGKWIAIALGAYVGLVVVFESLLGYFQPASETTLVITTTNADGETNDRVLARIEVDDTLYVAVNHWPRAWYHATQANPRVHIKSPHEDAAYNAVQITGAEYDKVNNARALGFGFRFLTGFPQRHILRLDPVE